MPTLRRSSRSRQSSDDCGSALVEMAVSAAILMSAIFGIIMLSIAVYSYCYVSYAAREASRYAIVRGYEQTTTFGNADCISPGYANCVAQSSDIQAYVRNVTFPGIDSSKVAVTTSWLTSTGAACVAIPANKCKIAGNIVRTVATYSYGLNIPFSVSRSLSMSSTSQMVISF